MATTLDAGNKGVVFYGSTSVKIYLTEEHYPRGDSDYIWLQLYCDRNTTATSWNFTSSGVTTVTLEVTDFKGAKQTHSIQCGWCFQGIKDSYGNDVSTRNWGLKAFAKQTIPNNGTYSTNDAGQCMITKTNSWGCWFRLKNGGDSYGTDAGSHAYTWRWSISGGGIVSGNSNTGTSTTTGTEWLLKCYKNDGTSTVASTPTGPIDYEVTLPSTCTRSNTVQTGITGYKVTFNAGAGTCSTTSLTSTRTKTISYTLTGWNTAANGSGTAYAKGGTVTKGYKQNLLTNTNTYNGTTNDAYNANNKGLYLNSGGNGTGSTSTSGKPTSGDGYQNISTVFTITSNTTGNRDFIQRNIPYIDGQQYTVSWWEKGSGTNLIRIWDQDLSAGRFTLQNTALSSSWTRKTVTFTANTLTWQDSCTIQFGVQGASSSASFCGFKIELGSSATAYTPDYASTEGPDVYAQWSESESYTNNAITLPAVTPPKGYTFAGWYTASSGGTRRGGAGDSWTPGVATTLYAQFLPLATVHINIGSTWKSGYPWVNVNGTWKKGVAWVNVNGTWKVKT